MVDSRPRGLLSVTAPIVYGRLHLAPLVPAFIDRYPDSRLQAEAIVSNTGLHSVNELTIFKEQQVRGEYVR